MRPSTHVHALYHDQNRSHHLCDAYVKYAIKIYFNVNIYYDQTASVV
jgi:hypothetical protein